MMDYGDFCVQCEEDEGLWDDFYAQAEVRQLCREVAFNSKSLAEAWSLHRLWQDFVEAKWEEACEAGQPEREDI